MLVATLGQCLVAMTNGPGAVAAGEASGAWTVTSQLSGPRAYPTATVLDGPACRVPSSGTPATWCGKVLAAGGERAGGVVLDSAELYDPATGRWTPTGDMVAGRYQHTATLLDGPECQGTSVPPTHCGKVLVAGGVGGENGFTALDSAELYDPATGAWTATGRMGPLTPAGAGQPRYLHRASPLDGPLCRGIADVVLPRPAWCGNVLVVGGLDRGADTTNPTSLVAAATLATAELYDPVAGRWAPTGSTAVPRFEHTLTAIDDGPCQEALPPAYCGKVLVAGGRSTRPVGAGYDATELYDPVTGVWVPTGPMGTPRFNHQAVLLDGPHCRGTSVACNRVLVVGGVFQQSNVNPTSLTLATAEEYDPLSGTWSGNVDTPRGVDETPDDAADEAEWRAGLPDDTADLPENAFDLPGQDPSASMGDGRSRLHTLTVLDGPMCRPPAPAAPAAHCGKVVVAGGAAQRTSELYDPASRTFTRTLPQLTVVAGTAVLIDGALCRGIAASPSCGRVLVFGDRAPDAELFDGSASVQPPSITSMEPRFGPVEGGVEVILRGAGFVDDRTRVYFGGVEALDVSVQSAGTMSASSPAMDPAEVDVTISTPVGTSAATNLTRFTVFGATHEWATTGSLVTPRPEPTVTPLVDGRVLVAGGKTNDGSKAITSTEVYDPSSATWEPLPSLATARYLHTATRLSNGKVLVAGGTGLPVPGVSGVPRLASAEVFDPATGIWRETGDMTETRTGHTATLLASGKVLVAGGDSAEGVRASAEIYDPELGTWTPVASMHSYRKDHRAVSLRDGRVLVIGGQGCDETPPPLVVDAQPSCGGEHFDYSSGDVDPLLTPTGFPELLRSAEVYDPATGAWSPTGGLDAPRYHHTVTELPDGRVLVAGGCVSRIAAHGCGLPVPVEIYEPDSIDQATGARGAWRTGPALAARHMHTATLLAGDRCEELCGRVLMAGGEGLSTAELYDPVSGTSTPASPMSRPRERHRAVVLPNGDALAVGGDTTGIPRLTGSAEIFRPEEGLPLVASVDPPAGPPGTLIVLRGDDLFGTTAVDFGGVGVEPLQVTDRSVVVRSPVRPRGTVPVSVHTPLGNSINDPLSRADDFTYPAGRWASGPAMETSRYLHTATLLDGPECRRPDPPAFCGRVLVAGGTDNFAPFGPDGESVPVPHASSEVFDPTTGGWTSTGSLASPRFDHTATLLDGPACGGARPPASCGKVLVAGGKIGNDAIAGAELYDPATGRWTRTGDLTAARFSHSATLLPDGRVLAVGGASSETLRNGLASAELYDPATGTWRLTAMPPHQGRNSHTATLLSGEKGEVLVAGGLYGENPGNRILEKAEIYDPGAGTWTEVESMAVPRFAHTAVRLDGPRCGTACGKVLVTGGVLIQGNDTIAFSISAELFDPVTRTWAPTLLPGRPRAGHTATLLRNGQVLVAGGAMTFPQDPRPLPAISAELFDPLTGRWSFTENLDVRRGIHTMTLLTGPRCRQTAPPSYCGTALAAGGATAGSSPESPSAPLAIASTERYTPAPDVNALSPPSGRSEGGTTVVLTGGHLAGATAVRFGARDAASFVVDSPTSITAVSPPADGVEPVEVTVEGPGGSSVRLGGNRAATFAYLGLPGPVPAVAARAVSATAIELTFTAADDGDGSSPAQSYIVKQSSEPITAENFDGPTAVALCDGTCRLPAPALSYTLQVGDLEPGRTYHYALRAVNEKGKGPVSADVSATTEALVDRARVACPAPPAPGGGTVAYPGGRYSLVGLPAGVVVGAAAPLYHWWNLGAGGTYSSLGDSEPVAGGRGYWAWFPCSRALSVPTTAGASATAPLDAYRASMVGNPSGRAATVTGHDFAATWDAANGVYRLTSYRQAQRLEVGEGAWVFSYVPTEVHIEPTG